MFPMKTMTAEELKGAVNCCGKPLTEDEQRLALYMVADVIPIPGGVQFKLVNGETVIGGNHDRAWKMALAILQAVIDSSRRHGGESIEMRRESLREFLAKNETAESYDQVTI